MILTAIPTPECGNTSFFSDWIIPGCDDPPSAASVVVSNSVLDPFVADVKQGVASSVKTMVTFWTNVPSPKIGGVDGSKADTVTFLEHGLAPLVAVLMAFTMLIGLVIIMWTGRAAGFQALLGMLLTYIGVQAIYAAVVTVALEVTDGISSWLIDQSTQGTSFADNLSSLFDNSPGVGSAVVLLILLIIAALVALFTSVLMIARGGILLALTGSVTLAVAISGVEGGLKVLRHYFAWTAAFILYKLAAAIVYSVGFRLLGTDTSQPDNGILQILQGLTILGIAVLALPAVIRIVVPAVAPAAQGRGAGAAAGAAGAVVVSGFARR